MRFSCPSCDSSCDIDLEWPLGRCPNCRAWLRSRSREGEALRYYVEVLGHPATRRLVEAPWSPTQHARMRSWLLAATLATLGLVPLLYCVARIR